MVQLREALLRMGYQLWYPPIRVDTWLSAVFVAQTVGKQLQQGQPRWEIGARVLSDDHFQFRGGQQERSPRLRTRLGERSVLQPRLW
jgi:hypothetical protein